MNNWDLNFISQDDYRLHIRQFYHLVRNASKACNVDEFNKNFIDPIKMTFAYFTGGRDLKGLVSAEVARQQDKTINNSVGYFHQNIFKYIQGWEVPRHGFDIINEDRHIYVELKNKHNTMNSASSQKTYINMQGKILDDDQATCLLVEVISTKSQDVPWAIKVNGESKKHNKIRKVSIDKFYEIVTGDPYAFKKIVAWLPITLLEVLEEDKESTLGQEDIIREITTLGKGAFFNGLYTLAFKDYQGFQDFHFIGIENLESDFR